jgi:hypothetical protein
MPCRARPVVTVVLLGFLLAGPVPGPAAEPSLDELMTRLLRRGGEERGAALQAIVRRGEQRAIPGLVDLLVLDVFLDSSVAEALERLSGQAFGHDWPRWVEWLAAREDLRPHPGYAGWKGALLGRLDPGFARLLRPGVPHRVRLEEIQWGGVRVDGIPALDHPRHVPAAAATYLTPDELVLGLVVRGEARAYPVRIMDWHEMANDVVAGVPISLAY